MLFALFACAPDEPRREPPSETTTPAPTSPTSEPTTTVPPPPPPEPCEVDPAQAVTVAVRDGRSTNDRALDVTVAVASPVAARCSSPDDPAGHWVESTVSASAHELHLQGLLPETTYSCEVAAVCPSSGEAASIEVVTGPAPPLPTLAVTVDPDLGMTGHYTLLPYVDGACSDRSGWIVIYDAAGVPRWWYELPSGVWVDIEALYHPEDGAIVWGGGGDTERGRPRVVDLWAGDVHVTEFEGWEDTKFSHDAKRLPDGRILSLDYRNVDADRDFLGFGVRAHDPATQTVSYDLDAQRYLDEGWVDAPVPFERDPWHPNWVEWVPHAGGDRLYLSLCGDESILSLDIATGDVRFKLGRGQGWTVRDAAGNELDQGELPQCQHGVHVVGDDVLLIYDNGWRRGFNRIVELALDPVALVATKTWEWTEPDWVETTLGDVDDLGNGRVLVTQAHPECWADLRGDVSEVVEVDRATGRVASRLTFPSANDTTYRSERYDGCAFFGNTAACPALAERASELASLFE